MTAGETGTSVKRQKSNYILCGVTERWSNISDTRARWRERRTIMLLQNSCEIDRSGIKDIPLTLRLAKRGYACGVKAVKI